MTDMPFGPFDDATAMLAALRDGQVSAVELLDHHLERIGRHNPALNAIVTPDYDNARARAQAADEARARGESAPLLGLPLTFHRPGPSFGASLSSPLAACQSCGSLHSPSPSFATSCPPASWRRSEECSCRK